MTMSMRIRNSDNRFTIWLPLFLILPVMLVIALGLAPVVLIAALVLWHKGWGKLMLLAPSLLCGVICTLRGMSIDISGRSGSVRVSVK